jgi:hypothetical protein
MNKSRILTAVLVISLLVLLGDGQGMAQGPGPTGPQATLGQGFTYQGQLKDSGGNPLTNSCDFQFTLWDALTGVTQVGGISAATGVSVAKGLFTAQVNAGGEFGGTAFDGQARWLEIAVKCSGDSSYATLSPRQALTPAPYALYSANSDLLDGQQGSSYQSRVSGACTVGTTIRAINADGSVVCQSDAPLNRGVGPVSNVHSTVASIPSGDTGQYTSITIGADGLPIISFYDVTNKDLRVAHCERADCSGAPTVTTVDSIGDVGRYSSIAIGVDGLPVISYYDATNGDLKVAHCENAACTGAATVTTVDNTPGSVGQYSSIAVGVDGMPIVSYYAQGAIGNVLKVAHCSNVACTSVPVSSTVDATSVNVGQYTSIAIGPNSLAAISYYDALNGDLKLAICSNFACSTSSLHVIDSTNDVGRYSSLAFGNDGLPVISYYDATNQDLRVAHCGDQSCAAVTTGTLYGFGNAGQYTSITIGADGLPVISFYVSGTNNGLRVAHCTDAACSSASSAAPISNALAGQHTAITIGVDGRPIISFYDGRLLSLSLRTTHCASSLCLENYRRR